MISPQFQIQKGGEIQQREPKFRLEASETTETLFDVPSPKIRKGKYSIRFHPTARTLYVIVKHKLIEVWLKGWSLKHLAQAPEPSSYVVRVLKEEGLEPTMEISKRKKPSTISELPVEEPKCTIVNTAVWDYHELRKDVPCITCLLPSTLRDDIRKFREVLDRLNYEYWNEILIIGYHYNKSREIVERILNALQCELKDLPIIVLSKRSLDILDKNENVVILTGDLVNSFLELPNDKLMRLIERIYLEIKSSDELSEKNIKKLIEEEINRLHGIISDSLLNKLKNLLDVCIRIISLASTLSGLLPSIS